jgi:5,10-methylenetetrahydromethanopterin reductase
MEFGCVFPPTLETPGYVRVAEQLGYRCAYVYDSPAFLADTWMTLARTAERTSSIRIGVAAITPRLRHLVANAGAIATLCSLAPDRVDVVVGSGFTSQLMLGKGPARWAEVEAYVVGLKALLRGEDVAWDGAIVGLRHGSLTGVTLPQEPPILVAAHGPKGYAVAERSAGGVVKNLGHHTANTGAADMSDWMIQYYGTVLDDGEPLDCDRVIDAAGPAAAFQLHIGGQGILSHTPEWAAYEARMAEIPADRRHLETHRGHLIEVTELERPLVSGDLIRQATGSGTRDEVRRNLDGIEGLGAKGVLYGPMGPDVPRELTAFAEAAGIAAGSAQATTRDRVDAPTSALENRPGRARGGA